MLKTIFVAGVSYLALSMAGVAAEPCGTKSWSQSGAGATLSQAEFDDLLRCYGSDDQGATAYFSTLYDNVPENEAALLHWYRLLTTSVGTLARSETIQRRLADEFLARIDRLLAERKDIEEKLAAADARIAELSKSGDTLESRINALTTERDLAAAKLRDHDRVVEALEASRNELWTQINALKAAMTDARKATADREQEVQAALTTNSLIQRKVDAITAELQAARAETATALKARDTLAADLATKDAALASMRSELASEQAAQKAAKEQMSVLSAELSDKIAALKTTTAALEASSTALAKAEKEKATAQAEVTRGNGKIAELGAELKGVKTALDSSTGALTAAERDKSALERRTDLLNRMVDAKQQERDDLLAAQSQLRTALDDNQGKVDELLASLTARTAEVTRLNEVIGNLSKDKTALEQLGNDLKQHNAEIAERLSSAEAERLELKRIVDELRGGVEALRAENAKLAETSDRLYQYRSQFLAACERLEEVIPDLRISEDSCILPTDVTFRTNSAELSDAGKDIIRQVTRALYEVSAKFPDVSWHIEVSGHTDSRPVNGGRYPSNWELSFARTLAVTKLMLAEQETIRQETGLAFDMTPYLAPVGLADLHPIDPSNTPTAWDKNRRTEFRLVN